MTLRSGSPGMDCGGHLELCLSFHSWQEWGECGGSIVEWRRPGTKEKTHVCTWGTSVCSDSYSRHNCLSSTCSWVRERVSQNLKSLVFQPWCLQHCHLPQKANSSDKCLVTRSSSLNGTHPWEETALILSTPPHIFNIGTKKPISLLGVLLKTGFWCWGFTINKVRL